jgi:hypothetical protein
VSPSDARVTWINSPEGDPQSPKAKDDLKHKKHRHKKTPEIFIPGVLTSAASRWRIKKLVFLGTSDTAAETLGEAIDTATGINNFLLTSVERVAGATYVNVESLAQS